MSYQLIGLTASNVKRIRLVDLRLEENGLIVIGGRNEQGKTSLLDSIEMALRGKSIPVAPIRRGEYEAQARVVLGTDGKPMLTVTRSFDAGGSNLKIEAAPEFVADREARGLPKMGPQALLDSLCDRLGFDPLEFARAKPEVQDEMLRKLDPAASAKILTIQAQHKKTFDTRTAANKEVKSLKARFDATPLPVPNVPAEEQSADALIAKIDDGHKANVARSKAAMRVENAERAVASAGETCKRLDDQIAEAEALLLKLKRERVEADEAVAAREGELLTAKSDLDAYPEVDVAAFQLELRNLEATNKIVRQNLEREKLRAELEVATKVADDLTQELDELEAQEREAIANAKWPVPGLSFSSVGVMLDGIPFSQASSAARLKASVKIGLARKPELRTFLIREGAFLDSSGMLELARVAEEEGCQFIVERVSDDGAGCTVVIEDGSVKGPSGPIHVATKERAPVADVVGDWSDVRLED